MEWILYCLVYWIIGFFVIYYMAEKSSSDENPAWVIIYAFGPFIWPVILCKYLFFFFFNLPRFYYINNVNRNRYVQVDYFSFKEH